MKPPKCCKRFMDLKSVLKSITTYKGHKYYLAFFQCVECGEIKERKYYWENIDGKTILSASSSESKSEAGK